eukprot:Blabericola_migrator_1__11868@NODE_722_length_6730_cov_58_989494_g520_i0_p3_GENE_NODE_722_length_6730_cov_58_989494_g520_i0NODE_722_length_6730_cov_58_989494_g520_i0_p3_ORF_typecomplete_len173_score13_57_NODE_722_length_6730_cov_58_989494_g520_i038054323
MGFFRPWRGAFCCVPSSLKKRNREPLTKPQQDRHVGNGVMLFHGRNVVHRGVPSPKWINSQCPQSEQSGNTSPSYVDARSPLSDPPDTVTKLPREWGIENLTTHHLYIWKVKQLRKRRKENQFLAQSRYAPVEWPRFGVSPCLNIHNLEEFRQVCRCVASVVTLLPSRLIAF